MKMNNYLKQSLCLLWMMNSFSDFSYAFTTGDTPQKTINSAEITGITLKSMASDTNRCFRYHPPTRFCIWVSPDGEDFTPYLDHYLPDLVVSAFSSQDNPWDEMRTTLDVSSNAIRDGVLGVDASGGRQTYLNHEEDHLFFKEIDVIGNPALLSLNRMPYLLLPSTVYPFVPYYQSMLDHAMWRGTSPLARVEELSSVKEGFIHHVGTSGTDWGGIYPHQGFVSGLNDAKATQVIAGRAADLLSNQSKFYPHVVKSIGNDCGEACHASPIKENSEDVLWQMIFPEEKNCSVLGVDSALPDAPAENNAYVWIIWRHYEGCVQGEGKFVGVTP